MGVAVRAPGDTEFLLFPPLPLRIRAKYMVAIYLLIAIAIVLRDHGAFSALLQLSGALAGVAVCALRARGGVWRSGSASGTSGCAMRTTARSGGGLRGSCERLHGQAGARGAL